MMHYKKNSLFFVYLYIVGLMAFATNTITILFMTLVGKLTKRSAISFSRIFRENIWKLGRNPKHYSSLFVDYFNQLNHLGKVEAASSKVLNVFYNYDYNGHNGSNGIKSFWIKRMNNSRGVANRKTIIVRELIYLLESFPRPDISFISLASGSAEAVIAAVQAVPQKNIKVLLVDSDESAIAQAKLAVAQAGLTDKFQFKVGNIYRFISSLGQADIIEMAGFGDYLNDEVLSKFYQKIKTHIVSDGYFVTCNIMPNPEKIFLDWVLLWPMYYRNDLNFRELLIAAGLHPKIIVEPLRTHAVAICEI